MAEEGKPIMTTPKIPALMTRDERFKFTKDRLQNATNKELYVVLGCFKAKKMEPESNAVLWLILERHPELFEKGPDGKSWKLREH
jgi:hypothetical protein